MKLTKKAPRTARPLIVNGTSMTRKSGGPRTKYGRGERSTPTASPQSQIDRMRTIWTPIVSTKTASSTATLSR